MCQIRTIFDENKIKATGTMTNKESMNNEKKIVLGSAFGAAIGSVIGVLTDNLALWISLGVSFGVLAGIVLIKKQKKADKDEN